LEALESSQGAAEEEKEQNPLRIFLAASMLSTDQNGEGDTVDKNNRVTISTIHSAKGCEWPCVFVCAVEDGVLPFYKCTETHELDEERCVRL
jgi:DNA helicase-2/ATP-dependent DNA helicase PcrA